MPKEILNEVPEGYDGIDTTVSPIGEFVPYYSPEALAAMAARDLAIDKAYWESLNAPKK